MCLCLSRNLVCAMLPTITDHILPPCPAVPSLNLSLSLTHSLCLPPSLPPPPSHSLSLPPSLPIPQPNKSQQNMHSTQHAAPGVRFAQDAPRGKAPSGCSVSRKFDRSTGLRGGGKIVRAKFLGEAAVQGGGAVRCMLQAGKGPASPSLQADLLTTYFHTRPTSRFVECDAHVHPVSVEWW